MEISRRSVLLNDNCFLKTNLLLDKKEEGSNFLTAITRLYVTAEIGLQSSILCCTRTNWNAIVPDMGSRTDYYGSCQPIFKFELNDNRMHEID